MTAARALRRYLLVAAILTAMPMALARADQVLEGDSRGQKIRALLLKPENPVGSVILLAGGHGRLDLGADGRIGWGAGNQLVRTRAAYARAGYLTLVPDIAPDLKTATGVLDRYRYGAPHARDIGLWSSICAGSSRQWRWWRRAAARSPRAPRSPIRRA